MIESFTLISEKCNTFTDAAVLLISFFLLDPLIYWGGKVPICYVVIIVRPQFCLQQLSTTITNISCLSILHPCQSILNVTKKGWDLVALQVTVITRAPIKGRCPVGMFILLVYTAGKKKKDFALFFLQHMVTIFLSGTVHLRSTLGEELLWTFIIRSQVHVHH